MFNWTTTTLINAMPNVNTDKDGVLRIGKNVFEKRWVESIRKNEAIDVKICKATIDMSTVATKIAEAEVARLYVYVGLEGSEESTYANDWYRKGMPLSISFTKDTPTNMADAIAKTVKQFNAFTKGKKILDVAASTTNLVLEGTHEYQRIQKIAILINDKDSKIGEEKVVLEYELNRKAAPTGITINEVGVNGFGTYSQLIKDLRLPTAANTTWTSVNKDEMPIVGAKYNQYIITYYAPALSNSSFTSVGNRSMSETTHIYWVKSDQVTAFETALANIDPDAEGLSTVVVDATKKRYDNKKAESVIGE